MRILFHDAATASAYDAEVMGRQGIGGTESTVVRVAEGLSSTHDVAVAQRARRERVSPHRGLRYLPLDDPDPFEGPPPDWVVIVRKHRVAPLLRTRFPSSAMLSWIHNWQRPESVLLRVGLARSNCAMLAVSNAHRDATDRLINGTLARAIGALGGGGGRIPVRRIYNPVDERLAPDDTPVDTDKLVFLSNKGIDQVLASFAAVREALPSLQLHVAGHSPETMALRSRYHSELLRQPGVHLLGRLPQHELFQHVRKALCVFYPQNVHAETFGLVFAESNALGTPVLAHDFGSAREVLSSSDQLVDARDAQAVVDKLREWREGRRPRVSLRPEFRASNVLEQWRRMLDKRAPAAGPASARS